MKKLGIGCFGFIGVMVILVILVAVGSQLGGGGSKTSASAGGGGGAGASTGPTTLALGQTASVKNWDVTAVSVDKPGTDLVWSQYGNKEVAAGTWYVVQMKLKNTGNTNFGVNSPDFELKDGSGVTYKTSDKLAAYSYSEFKGGKSISSQVPPGVEVTYYLVYDINPAAKGFTMQFKQDKKPTFRLE